METQPLVDLAPTLRLALLALVVALLPLSWVWLRQRGASTQRRLAALTTVTLFLTFDLIVFGAFTRLSDSGLGCPDWPGCYGEATPFGAREEIHAAQTALPSGPVTWSKAWIEMIHRYLAMTVGVLILVMAATAWSERQRLPFSPWWPTVTLVWVIVQGLFGKYTVTLKLYPAVVTLHLLGGLLLLALLAFQHEAFRRRPLTLAPGLRAWGVAAAAGLAVQIALGGWVSTNYAVLACTGFPQCNGSWWPAMDAAQGFTLLRALGQAAGGGALPFEALVAIHMAHRVFAVVVVVLFVGLAWRLWRAGSVVARRFAGALLLLLLAQLLSGLSNVVLGWPLLAALGHSAGAAGLVLVLALLLARSAPLAVQTEHRAAAAAA
ncbi:cytochrome C oxidase subunit I [beta proteobacterium AAP121]|nr:cytochrome C oxidase subunit I [beta proteobacterium AAP65]KPF96020.1 cytochrome C oxidase subunit I [beta proteobacterium AAP121]